MAFSVLVPTVPSYFLLFSRFIAIYFLFFCILKIWGMVSNVYVQLSKLNIEI